EERPRRRAGGADAGGERRAALRAVACADRAAVREGGGGAERGGAAVGGVCAAGAQRRSGAGPAGSEGRRRGYPEAFLTLRGSAFGGGSAFASGEGGGDPRADPRAVRPDGPARRKGALRRARSQEGQVAEAVDR